MSGKAGHPEKLERVEQVEETGSDEGKSPKVVGESNSITSEELKDDNLDPAASFLFIHKDVDTSHIDISKLRHKIDRNVVSIMAACFIMQFLDKAVYNYTAVMGIKKDLKLKGNEFSHIASAYAVAHLLMQVPNAFLIQKFPASKWLSTCVFGWGIVTICTAFVNDFAGMLTTRVFLAICEATIAPSLMLITAQWYTKSEQAPRFAIWHCAPGVGQILGGLLSFAFQDIPRDGRYLVGWRLMFIVLGVLTMFVGALTFLWLPDTPMNAKFLTTEEKVAQLNHVSVNMTGISNSKAQYWQIMEALKDPQIYLLVFPGIFSSMSSGLTGTYSTTLIHDLGYKNKQTSLLNMPTGITGIITNLTVGFGIRRTSNRWMWAVGLTVPGIIGASILSFLPQPNKIGSLIGIYMVPAIYTITTVVQQWSMSNVSGHTKRAFMAGMMAACHGIGNIIGPQTFQAKDKAKGYLPAKITVLATQAMCAVLFVILWQYYLWENRIRDRKERQVALEDDTGGVALTTEQSWAGLTDKKNPRFRYIY
ncbi:MFS general substrate transporter [Microthyrium microscopicum]|uniref:MFS general substrate transporter n=1 Tax=Microthyrium microscopicum TaxID=703497 RepID=A0A6A6USF1_9PEZI|nr:MFS general substrate transporter [Microthyrium microscopicum]